MAPVIKGQIWRSVTLVDVSREYAHPSFPQYQK